MTMAACATPGFYTSLTDVTNRPARAQLLGHLAPGFAGMGAVGLVEGLSDRGRHDGVLAARDMGQRTPFPLTGRAPEAAGPANENRSASATPAEA
jgi:hypothetical protein